jgi:hypothetical protein
MGMTNEQFDAYKTRELRVLERVQEEIDKDGKSPTLVTHIMDIRGELKKP